MPNTTRSTNLDLIRWLNAYHKTTAKKLAAVITNDNYLSQMANGERPIDDGIARKIEKTLTLPVGWMDRDNLALLKMAPSEFDLYRMVARYPDETKLALASFLSSLQP